MLGSARAGMMDGGGPGAPAAHADPIEKRYDGGHGPFSWQEFVHFYGDATAAERWNLGASNVEADGSAPPAKAEWVAPKTRPDGSASARPSDAVTNPVHDDDDASGGRHVTGTSVRSSTLTSKSGDLNGLRNAIRKGRRRDTSSSASRSSTLSRSSTITSRSSRPSSLADPSSSAVQSSMSARASAALGAAEDEGPVEDASRSGPGLRDHVCTGNFKPGLIKQRARDLSLQMASLHESSSEARDSLRSLDLESAEAGPTLADRPLIERFAKMIKMGVPHDAVEAKMLAEGFDPALLDNVGDKDGSTSGGAPSLEEPAEDGKGSHELPAPHADEPREGGAPEWTSRPNSDGPPSPSLSQPPSPPESASPPPPVQQEATPGEDSASPPPPVEQEATPGEDSSARDKPRRHPTEGDKVDYKSGNVNWKGCTIKRVLDADAGAVLISVPGIGDREAMRSDWEYYDPNRDAVRRIGGFIRSSVRGSVESMRTSRNQKAWRSASFCFCCFRPGCRVDEEAVPDTELTAKSPVRPL